MNEILERNLLALSSCDPELSSIIGLTKPNPDIRFINSKTNHLVPAQKIGDTSIPYHSKFDPFREGEKFLDVFQSSGYLVFLGFGAGFHIFPFLNKPEVTQILIIEKDYSIFRAILEQIDLRSIIIDPRVTFLIDMTVQQITYYILSHYYPVIAGNLKTIGLGSRLNIEKEYFHNIIKGIKKIINPIADDYTVQARFGRKWFINTILNLDKAEKSTISLSPVKKVMVTGAGPSLENQIALIKKLKKTTFLIATDTSLPALLHNKIKPDLIISIDCQQIGYHHFLKGLPRDIPLVLDLASPSILTRLTNRFLFFSSGHPFSQFLSNNWRRFPRIDTSGGNVSHAALSLAELLEAKEIYLFGVDFSYPGGKTYCRGTYLYPYFRSIEKKTNPLENLFFFFTFRNANLIKQKAGDTFIYTTKQLLNYKERMETAIKKINAEIFQGEGIGFKLNMNQINHKNTNVHFMKKLIAQGPASCGWRDFLKEYTQVLKKLPAPTFPVSKYLYNLSQRERELWLTLFPTATYLREYTNHKGDESSKLLKATIKWTINIIHKLLKKI